MVHHPCHVMYCTVHETVHTVGDNKKLSFCFRITILIRLLPHRFCQRCVIRNYGVERNYERVNDHSRGCGQTYCEAQTQGQSFDSRDGSFVTVRTASTFSKLSWPSASVFRFYAPLLRNVTVHFVRSIPYYDRNTITDDSFLLPSTVCMVAVLQSTQVAAASILADQSGVLRYPSNQLCS